ncbi:MAG: hypothetical protein ABI183_05390 [Polyangiaceae bacterium]
MNSVTRLRLDNRVRRVVCAALASALVVGCADQTPPAQNASDTKSASTSAGASTTTAENQPASETGNSNKTTRYAGWIVFAVGAQSAVIAAATSILMLHYDSVRSDDCNAQKVCSADGLQANTKLGEAGGFNAASWIVAAAGLGVGTYLVLTNPPSSDGSAKSSSKPAPSPPPPSAAIGVGPNGSGMGLNFRSQF